MADRTETKMDGKESNFTQGNKKKQDVVKKKIIHHLTLQHFTQKYSNFQDILYL